MIIWVILLIALILRLVNINQSYWLDEAIQVLESTTPFIKVWQIPVDFHPPLFHYLAYFWLKVLTIEWWTRLLPVFLGVFSVYFLYREIKQIGNEKIASIASLLLATSGFHVYYSQEFRPYMLSCFLATASYWFFIRFIRSNESPRPKGSGIFFPRKDLLGNKADKTYKWLGIMVNLLGLYSLYYFPFVLVSQFVVLMIFYRSKIIAWLKNIALSLLFFLPWLPMLLRQLEIGRGWASQFSVWKESVSTPLFKVLPLIFVKFWLGNISFENKIVYVSLVLTLLGFFSLLIYKAWQRERKITQTILIFLFVPIFLAFLSSFFVPTIAPKRLLLILPQFFFLISLGLNSLSKKWQLPAVALFLVINLISLSAYFLIPRFQREQWRQAIAWVEENALEKSLVLFEFTEPFGPWAFYQKGKIEAMGVFNKSNDIDLNMPELVKGKNQVFLFQYLVEMIDPDRKAGKWLEQDNYVLRQIVDFPGVGLVYEYIK